LGMLSRRDLDLSVGHMLGVVDLETAGAAFWCHLVLMIGGTGRFPLVVLCALDRFILRVLGCSGLSSLWRFWVSSASRRLSVL